MELESKNIIYVGGFGGIGYASCRHLLKQELKSLAIFDLHEDKEKLQNLKKIADKVKLFFVQVDVSEKASLENAFALAHQKMGNFDIVINGAGIMNERQIERTVEINLLGVINASFIALKYMDKSQGGQGGLIVNISSVLGLDIYGAYTVYTATKHGVTGFTRALADPFYFERTQVGFITICPGTTETPMLAAVRFNSVITFPERPPLPESLIPVQTADMCGQLLVDALSIAKNGSVWIISNGDLKEYTNLPKDF